MLGDERVVDQRSFCFAASTQNSFEGASLSRVAASTRQRGKRESEHLAQPIPVEVACTCDFRPYPHLISSFDAVTRRRHHGWIPPGFIK